ncbi:putative cyclin-D6-1 [Abeliophyllum distichum]|uniref:Cyclin-D6-1 n=1 Tax=Abeliophyllum distichum TaxID=126358 RepID=A0ABD1UEZ7_9LAMI
MREIRNDQDPLSQLFNVEKEFMPPSIYAETFLFHAFRKIATSFIETNSECDNFDAFIPYLAMNYIDRFVSTRDIPIVIRRPASKNTYLFLTCCLTIASKMRNDSFKLSEFLKNRRHLQFETKDVSQMELSICAGLQWKMRSVTSICFADYFINLLPRSPTRPFLLRFVHHLIVISQGDIELTKYSPSLVAASAVLVASTKLFPANYDEFKRLILSSEHICTHCLEEVSKCIETIEPLCWDSSNAASSSSAVSPGVKLDRDEQMNFKLNWTALTWGEDDESDDGSSRKRAAQCFLSFIVNN